MGLSLLVTQQPGNPHVQCIGKRFQFKVHNVAMVIFVLGDSRPIELDPETREPAGEGILR